MRKVTKKSLFIAAVLLCLAVLPMTARASAVTITISQSESVAAIQSKIQTAINNNDAVTVINANGESRYTAATNLAIDIQGKTVIWNAFYTGAPTGSTADRATLIRLNGSGTFVIPAGGWIEHTGSGRTLWTVGETNSIQIEITGGSVVANTGCAVYAEGRNNTVTVSGGTVYNNSQSNVQPAVNMAFDPQDGIPLGRNVTITGSGSVSVRAGAGNGFAIQTYGNVEISGGAAVFVNGTGRAINALGRDSQVEVKGNSSVWTKTGIAIRTGGDYEYSGRNAKVIVSEDALVYNEGTSDTYPVIWMEKGAGGNVEIIGGQVEARGVGGTAVKTSGSIAVSGGAVAATALTGNGRAIHATGGVTVSGGTVAAKNGFAIDASGAVSVSGGFVFAYGTRISDVVHGSFGEPSSEGIVAAWDRSSSSRKDPPFEYDVNSSGSENDLYAFNANAVDGAKWTGGGISYTTRNGVKGFFPIPEVTVISRNHGLIFEISEGKFYYGDDLYEDQPGNWDYDNVTQALTLGGFTWNVTRDREPTALTILDRNNLDPSNPSTNLDIELKGYNSFTAAGLEDTDSFGITVNNVNLTIKGDGALSVSGSTNTPEDNVTLGIFVRYGNLIINGGEVTAAGANEKTGGTGIFVLLGDVVINGGTVTAVGASPEYRDTGFGIVAAGIGPGSCKIEINGGTVTAQGPEQAIWVGYYEAPVFGAKLIPRPDYFSLTDQTYLYWENTVDADPGGKGTLVYPGSGAREFEYSADDEYVKIVAARFAIVTDGEIIGGTVDSELDAGQNARITLYGTKVGNEMSNMDVTDWFTGLPPGVTVRADADAGADNINLTFIGIPADPTREPDIVIIIPPEVLADNGNRAVEPVIVPKGHGIRFDIASTTPCESGCKSGAAGAWFGTPALLLCLILRRAGNLPAGRKKRGCK